MSFYQQHYQASNNKYLTQSQKQSIGSNKSHYSNRQQVQPANQEHLSIGASGGASTSAGSSAAPTPNQTNNNQSSFSSNTKTFSSQTAMLAPHHQSNNKTSPHQHHQQHPHHPHHHQQQQQQQHHQMHHQPMNHNQQQQQQQQQQQKQRQQQQQQHHRQAALQSQTLAAPAKSYNGGKATSNHQQHLGGSSGDNMTTSSSDHTINDDLHHLAHGFGAARLTGSRYVNDTSTTSGGFSSSSQSGSRFLLGVLFTLAELLLFTSVFLWLYWSYQHDDGFSWQNDRKQQFNTHAALMLIGFIFLNGQAMLIYRSFQCCSKIYTKILHTILFVLATSAISLGLILGYTAQENVGINSKPIMHFYSLHAWIGLSTVGLFVFQFVFGFVSFLILLCCEQATSKFRSALLPIHKTFGLIIFSLAIATCLTGLLQTARSRLSSKLNKVDYHELAEPGIVINLLGACLICLSILMPYIIRNLDIKRPFRSELDRHLKLSQLEMRI